MEQRKEALIDALNKFVRQRAGLEFGNYGDVTSYRAEQRSITRDRHDYRVLRAAVGAHDTLDADALLEASRHAFSGRLTLGTTEVCDACHRDPTLKGRKPEHSHDKVWTVSYCTGQYFPTEYRKAACAVLARALWVWKRTLAMPKGTLMHNSETGETITRYKGLRVGEYMRNSFRKEFGPRIAKRWFA